MPLTSKRLVFWTKNVSVELLLKMLSLKERVREKTKEERSKERQGNVKLYPRGDVNTVGSVVRKWKLHCTT